MATSPHKENRKIQLPIKAKVQSLVKLGFTLELIKKP